MSSTGAYTQEILERLHAAELEILRAIDTLCSEHNLIYFVEGGTALGAVRHGGFIPWDDDIDVGMPTDDYLRFLEIAPSALPAGISLRTTKNAKGFASLWAKLELDGTRFIDEEAQVSGNEQGIFVDVFCYSRLDKDERKALKQKRRGAFWQSISYLRCIPCPHIPNSVPFKPLVRVGCVIAHEIISRTLSPEFIEKRFGEAWETTDPSDYWASRSYAYGGVISTDVLFPTRPLCFEGEMFQAPCDIDAFLTAWYGDYHKVPPESERHNHLPLILDFGDGINVMDGLSME